MIQIVRVYKQNLKFHTKLLRLLLNILVIFMIFGPAMKEDI